jgi:hypothetical protein
MSTFKSEIEHLYAQRANAYAVASPFTAMFANSLNIVINTSLKGGPGFILELIQNAEDVGATEVLVRLTEDYLILQHNGSPFSMNDLREV